MGKIRKGTKKYKDIIAKGCGLEFFPYEGDYDCSHGYEWYCEDCPMTQDYHNRQIKAVEGGR
jgi:hypothetical protein